MKLSFSTIGFPDFSWSDIYSISGDLGYDGIELSISKQYLVTEYKERFTDASIDYARKELRKLHLSIPCLSTGCLLSTEKEWENCKNEFLYYLHVAEIYPVPYLRLLADSGAEPIHDVDDKLIIRHLKELIPFAKKTGTTLLIETNGVFGNSERLLNILTGVADDCVGALWDAHHTFRFFNESPEKTIETLASFIKHVHLKDSIIRPDGHLEYRSMGDGDIPAEEIIRALRSINYDGFISFEWLKAFMPELQNAAVVFPQFIDYMRQIMQDDLVDHRLQSNISNTGKYIWPKDTLIDLTLPQLLDRVTEEFPEQPAFRYTTLDYTRSYTEFKADVDRFACGLIHLGIRSGDHVAVWATNVPEWYIAFWATVKVGAVLVTVNTAYKIHELRYLLRQSDTNILIMIDHYKDSNYSDIISKLCPELNDHEPIQPLHTKNFPFLRYIVNIDKCLPGCLSWEDVNNLADKDDADILFRRAASVSKNDVCNMQYTSGTTGFPKGVMLTHYNIINNGKTIGDCMDLSTADRMLIHVPMFHCFGMVLAMMASVSHGVTMSPLPTFSPSKSLECIDKEKITVFHGVPTMFIAMLNQPNFSKIDFSYMRTGIMAGSPCPIKIMNEVIEKMHMSEICIVYGQTEASPGCTMSKTTDSIEVRVNTVGSAMFGVECKIVDPETNEDLPDNTDGEFVARGYNVMKGYYKMPHATSVAIDDNGWLHTGDLARRDSSGNYRITGRIKDMIIRGGENIYPKEIEDFLYTNPKIKDVQVIGVPDVNYGEEIMACIILKPGESMTEEEVKQYSLANIAKHKVPRYVSFVSGFPMNAAGKILKYKMRENAIKEYHLEAASNIETA